MLKSLYSGVTGMRSQQTKMDVISNNIANVSTTGFKAGRVRFQDLISQIDAPAQGANANLGGINPHQIGMGVQVSGTDTIMTSGSLQTTGRALDFGIQDGDNSFFMVSGSGSPTDVQYTRDGGFYADHEGNLVTPSGLRVLGYAPKDYSVKLGGVSISTDDANYPLGKLTIYDRIKPVGDDFVFVENNDKTVIPDALKLQSFSIGTDGSIVANYGGDNNYVIGRVALVSFTNPDGLEKAGGNLYNHTLNAGNPNNGAPSEDGFGEIRSGFLEMSNVDLANEFTEMIVTSRAYQANSRSITTSDEMIQELLSLKR